MAARIGNRKNAETALAFFEHTATPDKDWQRLSGGSYRACYLHKPTGVVYKVEDEYAGDTMGNRRELNNARLLRRMEWQGVRIPMTSGFNVKGESGDNLVLAMEYIEGKMGKDVKRSSYPAARRELYDRAGFSDMHGENFIFEKGSRKLVPIDLGSMLLALGHGKAWHSRDDRVLRCGDGSLWG